MQTEWEALFAFVFRKGGTLRFCLDYCNRKAVTKQDPYLILSMNICIDSQ